MATVTELFRKAVIIQAEKEKTKPIPAGQFLSYYASESAFQINCVLTFKAVYPHLAHKIAHIPNGGKKETKVIQRGGRSIRICPSGNKSVAMGENSGMPDLMLFHEEVKPVGDGFYCGLSIELKSQKGKVSPAQAEWQKILAEAGWQTHVLYDNGHGTDEFMKIVDNYLSLK